MWAMMPMSRMAAMFSEELIDVGGTVGRFRGTTRGPLRRPSVSKRRGYGWRGALLGICGRRTGGARALQNRELSVLSRGGQWIIRAGPAVRLGPEALVATSGSARRPC